MAINPAFANILSADVETHRGLFRATAHCRSSLWDGTSPHKENSFRLEGCVELSEAMLAFSAWRAVDRRHQGKTDGSVQKRVNDPSFPDQRLKPFRPMVDIRRLFDGP